VASFAESAATWPVMTAAKASYHKAVDKYLRSIRVGTKSIPRTAKSTHVNTSKVRTSELAAMILKQMRLYKSLLERFDKNITWPEGSLRAAEQNLRIGEAKDFRCELLKLNGKSTPLELWKRIRRDFSLRIGINYRRDRKVGVWSAFLASSTKAEKPIKPDCLWTILELVLQGTRS
jgi:hypothetical protein